MSLLSNDPNRRVVPRWRDFHTTVSTGELDSSSPPLPRTIDTGGFFEEKLHTWRSERTAESAAELVAAALVTGQRDEALEAARVLVQSEEDLPEATRRIARAVASPPRELDSGSPLEVVDRDSDEGVLRLRIQALRSNLRRAPRNPVAWVDLALAYSVLGQNPHAIRAIDIALQLAPENRFVLRSSARCFIHVNDPERAHNILKGSAATRTDPWLLAAEAATASVAGRSPRFAKTGRQVLGSGRFRPWDTSELASALGTIEIASGQTRSARRLFRESLVDPTDNTLAQAAWAAKTIGGIEVDDKLLTVPRSFEARAEHGFEHQDWRRALTHCEEWLGDEPFSKRPAMMGSYVAAVAEMDFRLTEWFARRGLAANPRDTRLLNNLVVGLASQGQVEEARRRFADIPRPGGDSDLVNTLKATEGLLRFREGDGASGRVLYMEAIEALEVGSSRRVLAIIHLAREMLLSGEPDARAVLALADLECRAIDQPEILVMLEGVRRLAARSAR